MGNVPKGLMVFQYLNIMFLPEVIIYRPILILHVICT